MALILSIMAIFAGLGSLWFASTALHKSENQLEQITRTIRSENKKIRQALESQITSQEQKLVILQRDVKLGSSTREKIQTQANELKREMEQLKSSLGELDSSIPQQLRRPPPQNKHPN